MHSRRNLACDYVTLLAMTVVDLNLLTAVDALLARGSVLGAVAVEWPDAGTVKRIRAFLDGV